MVKYMKFTLEGVILKYNGSKLYMAHLCRNCLIKLILGKDLRRPLATPGERLTGETRAAGGHKQLLRGAVTSVTTVTNVTNEEDFL